MDMTWKAYDAREDEDCFAWVLLPGVLCLAASKLMQWKSEMWSQEDDDFHVFY